MSEGVLPVLAFEVDDVRVALRLDDVAEVVRAVAVAPLPSAPAVVLGAIDVRGRVVPVLDVRSRFGLPSRPVEPADDFVLATAGGRLVALHVDRAARVLELRPEDMEPPAAVAVELPHVAGIARTADGLVVIQDLEAFLSRTEAEALDAALDRRG